MVFDLCKKGLMSMMGDRITFAKVQVIYYNIYETFYIQWLLLLVLEIFRASLPGSDSHWLIEQKQCLCTNVVCNISILRIKKNPKDLHYIYLLFPLHWQNFTLFRRQLVVARICRLYRFSLLYGRGRYYTSSEIVFNLWMKTWWRRSRNNQLCVWADACVK